MVLTSCRTFYFDSQNKAPDYDKLSPAGTRHKRHWGLAAFKCSGIPTVESRSDGTFRPSNGVANVWSVHCLRRGRVVSCDARLLSRRVHQFSLIRSRALPIRW